MTVDVPLPGFYSIKKNYFIYIYIFKTLVDGDLVNVTASGAINDAFDRTNLN